MGPTRSTRLPRAIDDWFAARLSVRPDLSASELLIALIHGGLRLREGYMAVHRRELERHLADQRFDEFRIYVRALIDTFGPPYAAHLLSWLRADGFTLPEAAPHPKS